MKKVNLAVVGATGMVGRTFLKVLEERALPIENFTFSPHTVPQAKKSPLWVKNIQLKS